MSDRSTSQSIPPLRDDRWADIASRLDNAAPFPRLVYAAAHLVMKESYAQVAHTPERPGSCDAIAEHIDWEATTAFRRHLISHGFGIAEAMDTAQRYEIGWHNARELIDRCGRLAPPMGFIAGAGYDQLQAPKSVNEIVDAAVEQCAFIRSRGGWAMILAMPWLSAHGVDEAMYVDVYRSIIRQVEGPVFIHWLGPMFLPILEGYFPGRSLERIMDLDPSKVRGMKISMLDADLERRWRRRLAQCEQIMLTGDDFHFGQMMIGGDGIAETTIEGRQAAIGDVSHGLLGIFDAIASPASIALRALGAGDRDAYTRIMSTCEELGRIVFEQPTGHYKAGLALLAWLNGLQDNPMLPNHLEKARNRAHFERVICAADACGAISDARTAIRRWHELRR